MRLTGAGVLVYTVHNGEFLVLLGKERETPGWRQGSHKWSAFSGKVEGHEDALHGAAREFIEEACGCVPATASHFGASVAKTAELLKQHALIVEQNTMGKNETLVYCTYVTRVDHAPYSERFASTRRKLLELDTVFRQFYRAKKQADVVPRFFLPGFVLSSRIVVADFHVVTDTEVEVTMHEQDCDTDLVSVFVVDAGVADLLRALEEAWRQVRHFIRVRQADPIFEHPAVNIVNSKDIIVSAFVNKSYLEKCEIKWWKLSEVLSLQQDYSWNSPDPPFRKLFLDNMTVIARHIFLFEQKYQDCPSDTPMCTTRT